MEMEAAAMWGRKPRRVHTLQELEAAAKWVLSSASRRSAALLVHFKLLTSRIEETKFVF